MDKRAINMTEGPLLGTMLRFTIPLILIGVLQRLFSVADMIVVGQFCGSLSMAAIGATGTLGSLLLGLFSGLSVGAGVVMAHAVGAGRDEEVHQVVHTAIPVSLISGLLLTIIGVVVAPIILVWMDTPSEYLRLSTIYMQVSYLGTLPSVVYNFGAALLRAAGDTKTPLVHLTLSGVLNVILNVVFVVVFRMDVAGVALATALSNVLAAALVLRTLCRRKDALRLNWRELRFHATPLKGLLRIGIPAGIQGSLFAFSDVLIQSAINSFGAIAGAGHAAAANIEGFVYIIAVNSLHQTTTTFVGQNVGALRYDRVRRVLLLGLACTVVGCVVLSGLSWVFGEQLLGLFIADSPQAVEFGMLRLTWMTLPYALIGLMEVAAGVLRGMGVSMLPTAVTILFTCGFRVLWIWLVFPYFQTLVSIYISYPISWLMTFVVEMAIYAVLLRRRMRVQNRTERSVEICC